MSDELDDDFLSFSAAPIPAALPKQPKQKSQTKKSTPTSQRKKVSSSATVYGEDLFQAAWKPAKAIVVCFHPFTKNYIRFSKDEYAGRFAIKHNMHTDGKLILYYFDPPFEWEFDPEAEFEIHVDNSVRVFGPYKEIDKVKLKVMAIIRAEILLGKKKSLEELRELEKAAELEAERIEDETEILTEQLANAGVLSNPHEFGVSQTNNLSEENTQSFEVQSQADSKKEIDGAKIVKDRKGSTLVLKPIEY